MSMTKIYIFILEFNRNIHAIGTGNKKRKCAGTEKQRVQVVNVYEKEVTS